MLKSLSTQFAATLFFGPLGLAYSSVAGAVFLTLLFAVFYFSELGMAAVLLIWPVAIIAGLVFVKLHNDGIRSSGSKLLLGPGDEEGSVGTLGSWGRGIAVLSLMGVVGYLVLWYSPSGTSEKLGRIVDVSPVESAVAGSEFSTENSLFGSVENSGTEVASSFSSEEDNRFTTATNDQQDVTSTILDSTPTETQILSNTLLYVDSAVVNLRDGPGTNFKILTQVRRGDELKEIDRVGGWVNVTASNSGTTGWILGRLVTSQ